MATITLFMTGLGKADLSGNITLVEAVQQMCKCTEAKAAELLSNHTILGKRDGYTCPKQFEGDTSLANLDKIAFNGNVYMAHKFRS